MTEKTVRQRESGVEGVVGDGRVLTLMLEKREWMPGNESPDDVYEGAVNYGWRACVRARKVGGWWPR